MIVVCGPTASGKTALSLSLAGSLGGEIVCADSMQVYQGMSIGTAKPTREEMGDIPHHLFDFLQPGESFSVAEYARLARQAIQEIHGRGRIPIVVGGTGLYIQALVDNIQYEEIASSPALRAELEEIGRQEGPQALWQLLREADPQLADKLHPNNRGRVIRALEVYRLTGEPMSMWQHRSRLVPSPYALCMLAVTCRDREVLYRRIDLRVDSMLEQGLVEEARGLWRAGLGPTASQAIGYKELFPYLEGTCTLEEAVEHIKMETRRYAKRQLTWLRRDTRIRWLYTDEQLHVDQEALRLAQNVVNPIK